MLFRSKLTSAGRSMLIELRAIVQRLEAEYLAPLSDEERETLHALLGKLATYHDPRCILRGPAPRHEG